MKKLGLALGLLLLGLAPAQPQTVQPGTPNNPAGAYNTSPPTCTASSFCLFQVDVNGNLKVTLGTGTSAIGSVEGTGHTTTQVSAAPTAPTFASLLAASATRKGCTIQNTGTTLGYIYFGATGSATTANSFQLAAGQPISCTAGNTILTDNVAGTCASGTCAFIISSQ